MKILFAVAVLASLATPALAQQALTADAFLAVAGLTPHSSLEDAVLVHGQGRPMPGGGIEYLTAGSNADAWLTFRPGKMIYVDCDEAPLNLPDDAMARLCRIATGGDWKKALVGLEQALSLGTASPGDGLGRDAPPEEAEHAPGSAAGDEKNDDNDFYEIARTFHGSGYTIAVEACPHIKTERGSWHGGVVISWNPA